MCGAITQVKYKEVSMRRILCIFTLIALLSLSNAVTYAEPIQKEPAITREAASDLTISEQGQAVSGCLAISILQQAIMSMRTDKPFGR